MISKHPSILFFGWSLCKDIFPYHYFSKSKVLHPQLMKHNVLPMIVMPMQYLPLPVKSIHILFSHMSAS